MSTFLVFGATGATGRFLLPRLLERGDEVHAVSRAPGRVPAPYLTWVAGDLYAAVAVPRPNYDVVISLGPLDAFAQWIAGVSTPRARRIVALSSMSTESKRESNDAGERALAAQLLAAEARLGETAAKQGAAWTILRPTLIYGDGRDRNLAPIARFARRWRMLPLPIGAHGLRQPVHAADIAAAVLACIDCTVAHGRIYPLGGGQRLTFRQMLLRMRAAIPGAVVSVPIPMWILRALLRARPSPIGAAALQRLREPLIADNARAAEDFGYAPRAFDAEAAVSITDG